MKKLFWVSPIALATVGFLAACGDDSSSSSGPATQPSVDKFADLDECTAENEGDKVLVKDSETTYVCSDGDWTEVTEEEKSDAKDDDSKDKKDSKDDSGDDDEDSGDDDEGKVVKCDGVVYDPDEEFCSNGRLYLLCDGEEYDPKGAICINGKLKTKAWCGSKIEYYTDEQFCVDEKMIYDLCGGEEYDPTKQKCVENKVVDKILCGAVEYDTDKQFCLDEKTLYDLCGDKEYKPETQVCIDGSVQDFDPETEFVAKRGDVIERIYKKVTIAPEGTEYNQTWMAENLKYEVGTSWCYDDEEENCETKGRLYEFWTAKRACPDGWHLPSEAELKALVAAVGGGNALKAESWNGTDTYGFSAIPTGWNNYNGGSNFASGDNLAYFWSSTEATVPYAIRLKLDNSNEASVKYDMASFQTGSGFAVRCIQDAAE